MNTNRCCLAIALLAYVLAGATAEAQKAGAVDAVRPQATIQRSTAELQAEKVTDVAWNDLLRTDKQGRVRVMLLDQSLISLGPHSELRVLRQAAASNQSALELAYGKVRMRLAKQPGQRFELRTTTAVAGVIGTDFGADASVPGSTHFICLEGEIRISSADPKIPGSVVCKGGYMTDVKAGQPPAESPRGERGARDMQVAKTTQNADPSTRAQSPGSLALARDDEWEGVTCGAAESRAPSNRFASGYVYRETGSLGILCLERGHHGMAYVGQGKFFKIEFGSFLQVGNRLFDRRTLADGTHFWALGDVEAAFSVQDGG